MYMSLVTVATLNTESSVLHDTAGNMLLEAIKQGRVFMVKYLLDSGDVDVNETDKQGQSALIKACLLEDNMAATRRKLTRLFLSRGASVGNVDIFGRNVLMWACLLGKVDVVKILLAHSLMDLDFNCVDPNGDTALHYVASSGRSGLVAMLVKAMKRFGVSVDKRNIKGITPLLVATKNGKEECARMLLDHGASANIMDPDTLTNTKELAENQNLTSLVELISTISPSTRSRHVIFPSKPDDNTDMAPEIPLKPRTLTAESAASSTQNGSVFSAGVKYCATVHDLKSARNQSFSGDLDSCKERKTFLDGAGRKRRKTFSEMSSKERGERFSEISSEGKRDFVLKTAPAGLAPYTSVSQVSKGVDCRRPHSYKRSTMVRPATTGTNEYSRKNCKVLKDPFDVRELKDLLSLYGEQKSSTFRTAFTTPVMTENQFQKSLKILSSPPVPQLPPMRLYSSRRSSSSTISSNGRCPLAAQGQPVFLKDRKLNDTCPLHRRTSSVRSLKEFKRITLKLTQNLSEQRRWNWRGRARRGSCPANLLVEEAKGIKSAHKVEKKFVHGITHEFTIG